MRRFSIFLLTSFSFFINPNELSSIDIDEKHAKEYSKLRFENYKKHEWKINYEKTLNFIREHEGFHNGLTYIDLSGHATIGYGHVVLPDQVFADTITKFQADSLLKSDFNKALKAVERFTNLEGNQKLAIAHFVYSKGVGAFSRSKLLKKINAGKPIASEILKWSHYRNRKGRLTRSEFSYQARLWELELYNSY